MRWRRSAPRRTPVHVQKLLRLTDEIVFCFDGDAAGRKAAWRALEVSLPLAPDDKPIRFLFLPEGDDPDTYVRKHGKDGWQPQAARGGDADAVPARAAPRRMRPRHGGRPRAPHLDREAACAEDHRAGAAAAADQRDRAARPRAEGRDRGGCSSCRRSRASRARRRHGCATPRRTVRNGACSTACSAICRWSSTSMPSSLTPSGRNRRRCSPCARRAANSRTSRRSACSSSGCRATRPWKWCCAPIDMGKRSAFSAEEARDRIQRGAGQARPGTPQEGAGSSCAAGLALRRGPARLAGEESGLQKAAGGTSKPLSGQL